MNTDERLNHRHFLVVDDEEFLRRVVARYLTQAGAASVSEAADGTEAIAALARSEMAFDAVITDLNMRPMNGLALLQAIRTGRDGLKRNTAVVMLTAHAEANYVAQALALDADSFVIKPVSKDDLLSRLLRVLEKRIPIRSVAEYEAVERGDRFFGTSGALPRVPAAVAPVAAATVVPIVDAPEAAKPRTRRVPLELIEAGAILAEDVFGRDNSAKFLAAQTVLSATLLARLRDLREINSALNTLTIVAAD